VPSARMAATERIVISSRFRGSRGAYLGALRARRASAAIARGIIGDALRRAEIAQTLKVPSPTPSQVALFYLSYPDALVRLVRADTAALWLGGRRRGYALSPPAPPEIVTAPLGKRTTVVGPRGPIRVTAVEQTLPLGAVPLRLAATAVRTALHGFARGAALDAWALEAQNSALNRIVCLRDDLPSVGAVDLTSYLPFLAIDP
jgi:hypothetical protein